MFFAVASQLLDPDSFSSPYSGLRISSFFDFGNVVEADCWPLLTVAYDLPRNGLLGVCSSDREADEWIRLNLCINYSIRFTADARVVSYLNNFVTIRNSSENRLREAKNLKVV